MYVYIYIHMVGLAYLRLIGVPTTELLTSFYYENFIHFGMGPKSPGNGKPRTITFCLGNTAMPCVAVEDLGKVRASIHMYVCTCICKYVYMCIHAEIRMYVYM
jgi:hypothetical protein